MHIRILEEFLASLQTPLQSLGAAGDLGNLRAALAPFADWTVTDFTAFLQAAAGFRRTGQVDIPKPEDGALKRAIEAFAAVRRAVATTDAVAAGNAQKDAAAALAEAAAPVGLTIKATVDKKWVASQLAAARAAELTSRLRALAARITGPESYAALHTEIAVFDGLPAADWKLIATSLGQKPPTKNKTAAILTQLTGHALPAPRKPGQLSADEIIPYIHRLRDRIARSNDRDAFPRSEVDAQIDELKPLHVDTIQAILKDANFSFSGGVTKANMLKKLREFLDAGHRAFERVQA